MNASTVIVRDLRRLARRHGTFLSRAVIGGVACLGLWGAALAVDMGFIRGMAKGKAVLLVVSQLLMFVCAVMGVSMTADTLSEERRDGTLGLLFLTPLSRLDLLLGRLVSSSLTTVYGLVGLCPVVGLTMLFGGVSFGEFLRLILVLFNMLFLSLMAGLFVSSGARDARRGLTAGIFLIAVIVVGPYFVMGLLMAQDSGYSPDTMWPLLAVSPIFSLVHSGCLNVWVFDSHLFWASLAIGHGLGWVLFIGGAVVLRQSFLHQTTPKERPSRPDVSGSRRPARSRRAGLRPQPALRRRLLDAAPYSWLMGRELNKRGRVEGFLVGMLVIGGMAYARFPSFIDFVVFLLCFVVAFLKVWFLVEIVTRVWTERGGGSFELLLTSPLGVDGILRGINQGMWRQFGRAFVSLFLVALFLYFSANHPLSREFVESFRRAFWPGVVGVILDLWVLKWAGIWSAMTSRGSSRAYLGPLVVVLAVPWLLTFCVGFLFVLFQDTFRLPQTGVESHELVQIWMWCSFPLVLLYGLRARFQVIRRTWSLAVNGFDYRSAEADWISKAGPEHEEQASWRARLPWPKTFRWQLMAGSAVLVVGLVVAGQVRRIYYERQLQQALQGFRVKQLPLSEAWLNGRVTEFGSVPAFVYDAMAASVAPLAIASVDVTSIEPALSQAPDWSKRFDRELRLLMLERVREQNTDVLATLIDAGGQLDSREGMELVSFRSFQEMRNVSTLFELLGCEIYYQILKGNLDRAVQALDVALRLKKDLVTHGLGTLIYFGQNMRQIDLWLRLVLSCDGVPRQGLDELDLHLHEIELASSPLAEVEENLSYIEAYSSHRELSLIGVRDPQVRLQMLVLKWGQFTGRNASEWQGFVPWAEKMLLSLDTMEAGDPIAYKDLSAPIRAAQAHRNRIGAGSLTGMIAQGVIVDADRQLDVRARVRLMRCAIDLERQRRQLGRFPSEPHENSDLAGEASKWRDPYSGERFSYGLTDEGYWLRTVPVWAKFGRRGIVSEAPLEWKVPVHSAALGDL